MRFLAWSYAASSAVGTVFAIRVGLAARILGSSTGRSPRWDAAAGVGTAVSAPWILVLPMLKVAQSKSLGSQKMLRFLLVGAVLGQLAESVVWDTKLRQEPAVRALVAANLAIPIVMLARLRNDFGTVSG